MEKRERRGHLFFKWGDCSDQVPRVFRRLLKIMAFSGPTLIFVTGCHTSGTAAPEPSLYKFRPKHFAESLATDPTGERKVIIISKKNRDTEVLGLIPSLGKLSRVGPPGTETLNLIHGIAIAATGNNLLTLSGSDAVESIWYIDEVMYDAYVRIIKSLEDFIQKTPASAVVNISIGPPAQLLPLAFDPEEPMNVATRIAAENNKVVIFAAGNEGPGEDTLNPWCVAPWVICVGASSKDGTQLAPFSSRGRRTDPLYRPTVVAPGIDILTAHPLNIPKTDAQREAEERTDFKRLIPPEKQPYYTVVSGTSFAAPHASRIAAQIIHFLVSLLEELKRQRGGNLPTNPTFAQIYTHNQAGKVDDRVTSRRLVGTFKDFDRVRTVIYPIEPSPTVIKQIIMDMAIGMPGYEPHEVGAGFVVPELAEHYFGKYGIVDPRLYSYKVL